MPAIPCDSLALIVNSARFCPGVIHLPGIKPYLYVISRNNITAWPFVETQIDSASAISMPESTVVYDKAFTLAADTKFYRIDLVENAGSIQWESQGSKYTPSYKHTLEVRYPAATEDHARGLLHLILHDDCVFLVPSNTGKYYVIGSEQFHVTVTQQGNFGEGVDSDDAGITLSLECNSLTPPVAYPHNFLTDDRGTVNGATDIPVGTGS